MEYLNRKLLDSFSLFLLLYLSEMVACYNQAAKSKGVYSSVKSDTQRFLSADSKNLTQKWLFLSPSKSAP